MNPPDNEHVLIEFDLPNRFRNQPSIRCVDLTRLQRASEGSGESTRGGRDDVIQCGGVRFRNRRGYFVVLRDGAVNAKDDRFRFGRKIGSAKGPFYALNSDFGSIDYV
jgi:hypothetical protein